MLAAFGGSSSAAPDPFLIGLATLDLLADAATRSPLLVIADDVQWLDRPTTNVLTFVARRLESDPIVMLFAIRDGEGRALLEAGLEELCPEPLNEDDAAKLLATGAPRLASSVRRQILAEALGNPLALVELPRALEHETRGDASMGSVRLHLTARLESAFSGRFLHLPAATQTALLVAALDDSPDLSEALAAASHLQQEPLDIDILTSAEASRLIDLRPGELHFRHPLVRSAIRQAATLSNRMAAHAALAVTLANDSDRQAWHRASAVIGRSEDVASDLEDLADRARDRGAAIVAVAALERAAALTPDPARRLDRLLRAAESAFELGRRDIVARVVEEAEPLTRIVHGPVARARMALVRGLGEARVLHPDRLRSLVSIAREAQQAGDANLAWNLLWRLAQRCFWADPGPDARSILVSGADEMGLADRDARQAAVLAYASPVERANVVIDRISGWPIAEADAEEARLLGSAAVVVGAFDLSMPMLNVAVARLRTQGRLAHLARALTMQGWSGFCLADWKVAIPALDEAVRMATETGETAWAAGARAMQASIAAVRGQPEVALALSVEAEAAATALGATHMLAYIHLARSLVALGAGRAAEAYAELLHIYQPNDPAHHPVPGCWYVGELAEAAVHSDHGDEARALIRDLRPLVDNSSSSWIRSAFAYAEAQLADDAHFEGRFGDAFALSNRWPFQRARLQLSYGIWLRRQRRVADARAPLRSARDAFDALGIPAWAERARQELRATGETSQSRTLEPWDALSPQEMQIATMAAEGLSNREIGERLYLSHRTVGSHLYRVFPKLGITTRAQLGAALARA